MIRPEKSLLKYDNPVLVSKSSRVTSPKGRSQQSLDISPVPPPPKQEADRRELEDVLNSIFPPREWTEGTKVWVQCVSSAPCTLPGVLRLTDQFNEKLLKEQALLTGICPIRREIYSQFFDELIRQETINCVARGLLLLRVREEINMSIATYRDMYESAVAYSMRKALLSKFAKADMEKRIAEAEKEKQDLIKQLNEQKAKCDEIEKRGAEQLKGEKKLSQEINSFTMINKELKNQLESIIAAEN